MSALIRFTKTHVIVLCPLGHMLTAHPLDKELAGSQLEAEISAHQANPDAPDRLNRLAAECRGAGHEIISQEINREGEYGRTYEINRR